MKKTYSERGYNFYVGFSENIGGNYIYNIIPSKEGEPKSEAGYGDPKYILRTKGFPASDEAVRKYFNYTTNPKDTL